MPSGGTESKKNDSQQRARRASRGGDAKANDLSAEDWNFLLRWQGQQDEGNWTLALAERLLPVSEAQQNTDHADPRSAHPRSEPSPASVASLEQKEASLGEYREQVQRWQQAQRQQAAQAAHPAGLSFPFRPANEPASPATGCLGALVGGASVSGALLGVVPACGNQPGEARDPTCWPGYLPPSPTSKAAGRPKRETSSPCSTTAPSNLVPPWLGQAISFTTWFQNSRQEQGGPIVTAPAQQFQSPGSAPEPARTLFADARKEIGRSERRPGRPRRPAAAGGQPLERAHTAPSDAAAAWPGPGPGTSDPGAHRGKPRAARLRGGRNEAAAEEAAPGSGEEDAARSAGGATLTRAGRVRLPSKRSLDAVDEDFLDKEDSPTGAERKSTAAPPSKAVKGSESISAGGAAQKRQPGAAASSVYRGVSRHRLTQRWEASLWLSGKQMYLGGYVNEEDAARAYDLAALACKGPSVPTNFAAFDYEGNLSEIRGSSREEIVAWVRRRSSAFSRGRSRFRGVSGQAGHWEARIGTFGDRKNVSFGIHDTEEEAARQYDRALIIEKGRAAKTNFPLGVYDEEVSNFEKFVARRLGGCTSVAARAFLAVMALPFDETAPNGSRASLPPVREKNRGGRPRNNAASIIFASALQQSLAAKGNAAAQT